MSAARQHLRDAHRVVVKLGTHVVAQEGGEPALDRIGAVVESLARLRGAGREVLLVSSGAVSLGRRVLGLTERPRSLGLRQACAAVGQGHLMGVYVRAFAAAGLTAAQVLLSQEDLADRDRALCLRTTLMRLLELGAVPVLNENDSVSVAELVDYQRTQAGAGAAAPIGFGDNDGLSARVAVALDADLLIMLTNVGGLFTANPRLDPAATRIPELAGIDEAALARASGGSLAGTGGMASKLAAARLATSEGTTVLIAGGGEPRVIDRALAGEDVGTLVRVATRRPPRLRHIAVGARHRGALVVNEGALAALGGEKASLLPIGVVAVEGTFEQGDVVEIRDGSGRVHGRGLVNYPSDACRKLVGRHSDDIDAILGWRGYDAVITRDNLVMGAV
jgi:glutamate 5-kinase